MKLNLSLVALGILVNIPSVLTSSETITYSYDARGRLIKVERAGTVNNGVQTVYTHDKANNRKSVTVTGSGNSSGSTTSDFNITDPSFEEGQPLVFTISRTGVTNTAATISYHKGNGSAIAGSDWVGPSGVSTALSFAANELSKTVNIATINDTLGEAPETVLIDLHGASSGSTIVKARGTGTITDNDGTITFTDSNLVVLPEHTAVYGCVKNIYVSFCYLQGSQIYVYSSWTTPQFDPGYSLSAQGEARVEPVNYATGVAP